MRVSATVVASLPGSSTKPGAISRTTAGAKIILSRVMAHRMMKAQARTALRNSANSWGFFSLYSVMTGTNEELAAPSPIRSRKRFGRRNATTNASAPAAVPKNCAKMISRKNPNTRLARVPSDMMDVERKIPLREWRWLILSVDIKKPLCYTFAFTCTSTQHIHYNKEPFKCLNVKHL